MSKRTAFQIEREIATAKQEYHDLADTGTRGDLAKAEEKLNDLASELSKVYLSNAEPHNKQQSIIGRKKRPGVYEIIDLESDLRSRGETPDEAADNWNNKIFFTPPEGGEDPLVKVKAEPEAASEGSDSGADSGE